MLSSNTSAVSGDAVYVEDVFSTHLYTGTSADQTITNGIDLAGKGGLVWIKNRTSAVSNLLIDTVRGGTTYLISNTTSAQATDAGYHIKTFNSNGFTLQNAGSGDNLSNSKYASWTFRKQPKFFDFVTYTGNGGTQAISHALGSSPGCVMIKRTDNTSAWVVGHRGTGTYWASETLRLNTTATAVTNGEFSAWSSTAVTVVNSGGSYGDVNTSGATYVMYVFAHDAGGFGLAGTDNVISCGSYTEPSSGTKQEMNIGFEAQFVFLKATNTAGNWEVHDAVRGLADTGGGKLYANTSDTETAQYGYIMASANGFIKPTGYYGSGTNVIYMAIRRPMKVPTDATKVFAPVAVTGNVTSRVIDTGFPVDTFIAMDRDIDTPMWPSYERSIFDRLLGNSNGFKTAFTDSWTGGWGDTYFKFDNSTGLSITDTSNYLNKNGARYIYHMFKRAPSFYDNVFYTGTGSPRTVSHNLTVAPELMLVKRHSGAEAGGVAGYWVVYSAALGNANALFFNTTDSTSSTSVWNSTSPTATSFTVNNNYVNYSGDKYYAYLFATCPGVSKVGSYTGNGSSQTIACGFTAGARFVLIKQTNATGHWYVWDTARGIVSGNDPSLIFNNTSAEVSTNDSIDPDSSGFIVNQISSTDININAATYIFLAIA